MTPKRESIDRGFALWREAMRWQRTADATLKGFELTHTQFLLLSATLDLTDECEDAVTQIAIGKFAGLDPATTSRLVPALCARDLLDRGPTMGDARAWRVILTDRGRALVQRITPDFELAATRFFAKSMS